MAEGPPVVFAGLREDRFKSTDGHYGVWRIKNFINKGRIISPDFILRHIKFNFIWERNRYPDTSKECFEIFLKCEQLTTRYLLKGITVTTYLQDQYDKRSSVQRASRYPPENAMHFRIWHAEIKTVFADFYDLKEEGHFVEVISRFDMKMGPKYDIRDQLLIKRYLDPWIFLNLLSEDSLKLLNSGDMADVTLRCGENTIRAHKSILSIRSKKFADLIVNNDKEINITDMDFFTLQQVLRYLYSGKVPEIPKEKLLDLNRAANRYEIEGLQKGCVSMLILKLEPEILVEQLQTGEEFSEAWFIDRGFAYLEETGHLPHRNRRLLCRQARKLAEGKERSVDEAP